MEQIYIGTPPPSKFVDQKSKAVHVPNFLEFPNTKGNDNVVTSPIFSCLGHNWRVDVYPGGDNRSHDPENRPDSRLVTIALHHFPSRDIKVDCQIRLIKREGGFYVPTRRQSCRESGTIHTFSSDARRVYVQLPRSHLTAGRLISEAGELRIQVDLKLCNDSDNQAISSRCSSDNMGIFLDEETSDIAFELNGETIPAHRCIIKSQAPDFYVLCETYDKTSPMRMNDLKPGAFKLMLSCLYGGEISDEEWKEHYESILMASCKYGFSSLKDEAESWYLALLEITIENAIDEFLKADGNAWAMVRANAKEFMARNGEEILESESFSRLYESMPLMKEVMAAALRNTRQRRV